MKRTFIICLTLLTIGFLCLGCKGVKISYSLTGAQIDPNIKTFSVETFGNQTAFAPNLGVTISENLKAYLLSHTSLLEITDGEGDIHFSGEVTSFNTKPMEIQANEVAASNRLTVEFQVRYVNAVDESGKSDFDTKFSHYVDYSVDVDYTSVEESMLEEIMEKVIDDIYNKAFVNW